MKKKAILISGTPGTGKTTLSIGLGKNLGLNVINIGDFAINNELIDSFDNERDSLIPNEKNLISRIKKLIKKSNSIILEGHYVDIIPLQYVKLIIILRAHPLILEKRLKEKGYKQLKVNENVAAEILGSCTASAMNQYNKEIIFELDTSDLNINESISFLQEIIKSQPKKYLAGTINYLKELEKSRDLEKFFQ